MRHVILPANRPHFNIGVFSPRKTYPINSLEYQFPTGYRFDLTKTFHHEHHALKIPELYFNEEFQVVLIFFPIVYIPPLEKSEYAHCEVVTIGY